MWRFCVLGSPSYSVREALKEEITHSRLLALLQEKSNSIRPLPDYHKILTLWYLARMSHVPLSQATALSLRLFEGDVNCFACFIRV